MKLYLIRHGESTSDIESRYGGDYDDHLTAKGRQQAQELAAQLRGKNIELIYSSPKLRAQETALILANGIKCRLEIVDGLRERNLYGIMTGMKKAEAAQQYPEQVRLLADYLNALEGGEAYADFRKRILRALDGILSSKHPVAAAVTHGGPLRCIFREALKLGEFSRDLNDCEVFEFQAEGSTLKFLGSK